MQSDDSVRGGGEPKNIKIIVAAREKGRLRRKSPKDVNENSD